MTYDSAISMFHKDRYYDCFIQAFNNLIHNMRHISDSTPQIELALIEYDDGNADMTETLMRLVR